MSAPAPSADARLPDDVRRIAIGAEAAGRVAIAALPLLRPLLWSGDSTDLANLLYLALLAAGAACGLVWRGATGHVPRRSWPSALGVGFLALAALGCWRSPFPADAAALWSAWALHLGAAWALAPLIVRHRGWAVAGLCAGLACECLLLVAQAGWERPDLRRRFADDPVLVDPAQRAQMLDRITTWRLEGSFLLANTLADYLLIVLPFALGLAWRAWRARLADRWWLAALAVAALVALARTGSKAGVLAGCIAAAATVALAARPRLGLAVGALMAVALTAALAVPDLRARAAASLGVRLDYWRGAGALVGERPWLGHGIDGFRCHWPRVKPAGAEDSIMVHSEPLQAAADLGLPAAALLLAWWAAVLARLRPRRDAPPLEATAPTARAWPTAVAAIAVAVYAVLAVGALADRAESWPHGGAWLLLIPGALAAAILLRAPRLPAPPAWCGFAAVAGSLIHAFADFHLHSPQIVGVLAFAAVIGLPAAPAGPPRPRLGALLGVALLIATVAGIGWSAWRGQPRERAQLAEAALIRLSAAGDEPDARASAALVAALEAYRLPLATDPLELAARAVDDALPAVLLPPEDPSAAVTIASIALIAGRLSPDHAERFTAPLERLAARWPDHLQLVAALARHRDLLAARDPAWAARAVESWRRVVALHPTKSACHAGLADAALRAGDAETARDERVQALRLHAWSAPQDQ